MIIEKWNEKNIPMIDNVITKRKTKRRKVDVDVYDYSGGVQLIWRSSGKQKPVRMICCSYQNFTFAIQWARDFMDFGPRRFLDEDDIKLDLSLENSVDDEWVLSDILQKDPKVLYDHC